jgi:hypothetical protein
MLHLNYIIFLFIKNLLEQFLRCIVKLSIVDKEVKKVGTLIVRIEIIH